MIRNKIKIDKFLDKLMPYINNTMNVYYEETPKNAVYPYGVIPDLSISTLDYGLQCLFDIELYINELSESNVEELCDNLRIALDGYSYNDDEIGFHVYFDSQYLGKMTEQDSTMRRVTFIARIF